MTVDSAAAATVVTTRGRASVGLAFMAVFVAVVGKVRYCWGVLSYGMALQSFKPGLNVLKDTLQERPTFG